MKIELWEWWRRWVRYLVSSNGEPSDSMRRVELFVKWKSRKRDPLPHQDIHLTSKKSKNFNRVIIDVNLIGFHWKSAEKLVQFCSQQTNLDNRSNDYWIVTLTRRVFISETAEFSKKHNVLDKGLDERLQQVFVTSTDPEVQYSIFIFTSDFGIQMIWLLSHFPANRVQNSSSEGRETIAAQSRKWNIRIGL